MRFVPFLRVSLPCAALSCAAIAAVLVVAACGSTPSEARPSTVADSLPPTPAQALAAAPSATLVAISAPGLEPDPAVHWGALSNGLRYALMRNDNPAGKVTLRLRVGSGSLLESDAQRGLAHYLEHMAFNGTTNYPPGTLIDRLAHLGLAFGAHTNAHTSFDETVYKLDLPDASPATLRTGLAVLADFVGGMLLQPKEVEAERGVVLAELRDRNMPGLRIARESYRTNYAGLIIGERFPIGEVSTLRVATPELLRAYFDDWYRPDRMVLAVVGAIDPAATATLVHDTLAGLAPRAPARPEPSLGTLLPGRACLYVYEAEAESTSVSLDRIRPRPRPADSRARRLQQWLRDVAENVLARRLRARIEADPDCPLLGGAGYSGQWLDIYRAGVSGTARPGKALAALQLLIEESRRLALYGPTADELRIEATVAGEAAERGVQQAAGRSNQALANALYDSMGDERVFLSPTAGRDLVRSFIAALDPDAVRSAYVAGLDGALREVASVTGREQIGTSRAEAETAIAAAWAAAEAAAIARPATTASLTWAYPPVVPVTGDLVAPDGGPLHLALRAAPTPAGGVAPPQSVARATAHGVVAQVCRNRIAPGQIAVRVRLAIPAGQARPLGLAQLASAGFTVGGLGKHPGSEIARLFAGTDISIGNLGIGDDEISLGLSCSATHLARGLSLLRAFLSDPGWRPEAEARVKASWLESLRAEPTDLDAVVQRRLAMLTNPDQPWQWPATPEIVNATSFAAARDWLAPYFARAPLSISVVGDIAEEDALRLCLGAFAVPGRDPVVAAASADAVRAALPMRAGFTPGEHSIDVPGITARTLIFVAWKTDDGLDIRRTRRIGLLTQCFSDLLRSEVRERLGAAYSPRAGRQSSDTYRGEGALMATVSVAPESVDACVRTVFAIATRLATDGVDTALLDRVKTPLMKNLTEQRARNDYWLGSVLHRAAWQPFRFAWADDMESDFASITPAELSALAKLYLGPGNGSLLVIGTCPGAAAAGPATAPAATAPAATNASSATGSSQ